VAAAGRAGRADGAAADRRVSRASAERAQPYLRRRQQLGRVLRVVVGAVRDAVGRRRGHHRATGRRSGPGRGPGRRAGYGDRELRRCDARAVRGGQRRAASGHLPRPAFRAPHPGLRLPAARLRDGDGAAAGGRRHLRPAERCRAAVQRGAARGHRGPADRRREARAADPGHAAGPDRVRPGLPGRAGRYPGGDVLHRGPAPGRGLRVPGGASGVAPVGAAGRLGRRLLRAPAGHDQLRDVRRGGAAARRLHRAAGSGRVRRQPADPHGGQPGLAAAAPAHAAGLGAVHRARVGPAFPVRLSCPRPGRRCMSARPDWIPGSGGWPTSSTGSAACCANPRAPGAEAWG
jgi:hypothetical protein